MLTAPITKTFEEEGLTAKYLAWKLKRELNAKKVEVFKSTEDEVLYSRPLVDWDVMQRARVDRHRLLGRYPAEKREIAGPGGTPLGGGESRPIRIEFISPKKTPETSDDKPL